MWPTYSSTEVQVTFIANFNKKKIYSKIRARLCANVHTYFTKKKFYNKNNNQK